MKKNIERLSYFISLFLILGSMWLIFCFFGIGKIDEAEGKTDCCTDQLKKISADNQKL